MTAAHPIPITAFADPLSPAYHPMDVLEALRTPPPPMRWLVEGLIPLGVPGALVAKPGCGKSQVSLDLGLSVALGIPLLGQSAPDPMGVVYLSMEDPEDEMHRRLVRIADRLVPETDALAARDQLGQRLKVLLPDHRLGSEALALQRNRHALVAAAQQFQVPCGLIVLDTQNALFPGEENSSRDVGSFWGECQALAQETGATVLVLHHLRKSGERAEAKSLSERLSPENLRGSSAIEGRARFVLVATPLSPGEAASVGLEPSQAHGEDLVILAAAKVNGGPKGRWFLLERPVDAGDGLLCLHPRSESLVQQLLNQGWDGGRERRGGKSLAWKVLHAIALAGSLGHLNHELLLQLLWPKTTTRAQQLQKQLAWLRQQGYLEADHPTQTGLAWLLDLPDGEAG